MIALGVLFVLASVGLGVLVRHDVPVLDRDLHEVALTLGPAVTRTAEVISLVLSPGLATITLVALGSRALLARDSLLVRASVLFGLCWTTVLARDLYRRIRPIEYDLYSYPSGHVTAVATMGFVGVLLTAHLARDHVRTAIVLAVTAIVLTAASRVVVQYHWFTDTVGAVLGVMGVGLLGAHALRLTPVGVGSRSEQS
ncbi:phosphatase PAP2 family protein [Saccharothrix violaceirubra]|uniref:Undecaprenyl-diphosphatase n=1 Tax=Saccharothrix violaceirubra TaxID=413306 RepID=A0A7W7T724_9PSEU|nr:phosphatase PAP2 family protein [Saccharothrix violaceirubra]MBB4967764.1 undecaprenyl-diphosphatase [Saccharothrix violaceirubra]